ncbi:cell death abnormality protein 1-like [Magallana gigas]|uniref:cell death abnormality protein 1-like n=1 Tax=Magallana gigas TaxID=29159 RepID=UPI00333E4E3E
MYLPIDMVSLFLLIVVFPISQAYVNVALHKHAHQQYPYIHGDVRFDASKAVDGRKSDLSWDGGQCAVSDWRQTATWWIDLTSIHSIHHITIYFRTDNYDSWFRTYVAGRVFGFSVYVSNTTDRSHGTLCFKDENFTRNTIPFVFTTNCFLHGQYVIYYNERLPGVVYPDGYDGDVWIALCEVEVYGCPVTGFYGSDCSIPCPDVNCQYCHIETGTCQGCKPGYKGHHCKLACNIGYFGVDCNEKCGRCLELYQCNHITGTCLTGCEAGYQGSMCKTRCDKGSYGHECKETCGHCRDLNQCFNVNGSCLTGCDAGFNGELCETRCDNGAYGFDCKEKCGNCRKIDQCFHTNGTCLTGCDGGYQGDLCKTQMNLDLKTK